MVFLASKEIKNPAPAIRRSKPPKEGFKIETKIKNRASIKRFEKMRIPKSVKLEKTLMVSLNKIFLIFSLPVLLIL